MPNHPPIREILEQALLDSREQRDRNGALYVTDTRYVVGGCPRELKLELLGEEKRPYTPGELWMFDRAQAVEDRVIEMLKDEGITGEEQSSVVLNGGIRGRIDYFTHEEPRRIIEVKSVRGKKFDHLTRSGPQVDHVTQTRCYGLGHPDAELDLFYADREGQNGFREFPIEHHLDEAILALRKVQEVARNSELPPILKPQVTIKENIGANSVKAGLPWQCRLCKHRDVSCDGAIPKGQRPPENKIIGHIKDGEFVPKQRLTSVVIEAIEEKMNADSSNVEG